MKTGEEVNKSMLFMMVKMDRLLECKELQG